MAGDAKLGEAGKRNRLGKGLEALFGEYLPEQESGAAGVTQRVRVADIAPNPFQPRRGFLPEQLAELEASIRENGLLQPLVVRPATERTADGAKWELIAGERRWRAVRRLGWSEVPVVVKSIEDRAMLILAIVENVQRADLSPLEEAAGYRQLMDEFGYTQQQVAESVGRERSTVANLLRLLQLPASVQRLVNEGRISMGHARAILGLNEERHMGDLARQAAEQGLSVRTVEERVRARRAPAAAEPSPSVGTAAARDPHVRHLETELQRAIGTAVRIHVARENAGRLEIPFYNAEDFDRVIQLLLGPEAERY